MSIGAVECDFDNHQVMDMLKIFPNSILGMVRISIMNDQVSGGSDRDFIRDMAWQYELPFAPTDHGLDFVN